MSEFKPAVEVEAALLGQVLIQGKFDLMVSNGIVMDHFCLDSHRLIFAAMASMHEEGIAIDLVTLARQLEVRKTLKRVGGVEYIASLTDGLPRRPNVDEYATLLKKTWTYKNLCALGERVKIQALDQADSPEEIIAGFMLRATAIRDETRDQGVIHVSEATEEFFDRLEKQQKSTSKSIGLTYGIPSLDLLTTGMHPGETTVIGGRPGYGKSAFAVSAAMSNLKAGVPVYYRSDEMRQQLLYSRAISSLACVNHFKLRDARLLEDADKWYLKGAADEMKNMPLYIDDKPGLHIDSILGRARKAVEKYGVQFCIFDYLQIMRNDGREVRDRVGNTAEAIAKFARETNTHCMELSQLSRPDRLRSGKMPEPTLTDLRESGRIEDNADVVILLQRAQADDEDDLAIVAKQRNGPTGTSRLQFLKEILSYVDREPRGKTA